MSIPNIHDITLPLLELLVDGKDHNFFDLMKTLSKSFELTESDLQERIASGNSRFQNRLGWARTELKMAGLIEYPKTRILRITQRGLDVLKNKPPRIHRAFLQQFSEYREKVDGAGDSPTTNNSTGTMRSSDEKLTPEESMDAASQSIRSRIKSELLEKIMQCTPAFFERLVVDLLVKMGYGGTMRDAGEAIGKSGDGGIDGTIKEDKLGLDVIYLQAKRWESGVGRPQIQNFVGALHGKGNKGVFITTSSYSKEAIEYAKSLGNLKIILIDGDKLADLMIEHNVGVSPKQIYEIKKVDYDYFSEEE